MPGEWAQPHRAYAVTVHLVRRLTANDLLQRIRSRGTKHADHTRALVKEKYGCCYMSSFTHELFSSLGCAKTRTRKSRPCR